MPNCKPSEIFVIGGTGSQGLPVVRGLVADGKYHCKVLTRDANSSGAQELAHLPNVSLMEGTFANEETLRAGFSECDGAFVNMNGFNTGEKTEMFWAIRSYEIALESRIKFFVYGNLDYILQQNKENAQKMGAELFTTGPYIEISIAIGTPMTPTVEDRIATWRDCAQYVRWLFDHQDRANGLDLEAAIAHIGYEDLASAFETVTGYSARYIDTDFESYWKSGSLSSIRERPNGYNADPVDMGMMTARENFTGFWNIWRASGQNKSFIRRDYALLDEIYPGRIKSAEEWFRKEEERGIRQGLGGLWERIQEGNLKPAIKAFEDGFRGRL
ncbi:NmrA family protein [Ampelomyces quisqualis]|uniref:NmrA family protein n=1 Tax=Ampelomyces quisqualis TaxID=50730 RepID=A0A6A5QA12_AMPQU|nr:NmrA family protein [Ampelomyces quisqualis]